MVKIDVWSSFLVWGLLVGFRCVSVVLVCVKHGVFCVMLCHLCWVLCQFVLRVSVFCVMCVRFVILLYG